MKKTLLIAALCFMTASFTLVHAENSITITQPADSKISVQDVSNLRLKVLFNNTSSNQASIKITDDKGDTYLQDLSNTDEAIILNLTNLVDGSYTLTVIAGDDKLTYAFDIKSQVSRVAITKSSN